MKIFNSMFLSTIAILIIVFFVSCSDKKENPVGPGDVTGAQATITLNGAGYTNKSSTLSTGAAGYSISDTTTAIVFSGKIDSDTLTFTIIFKGNQARTIAWNYDEGAMLFKYGTTGQSSFIGYEQGTTTVTSYGAVGNKIEGSIVGKLVEASTLAELNISGNFSAVRVPDIQ